MPGNDIIPITLTPAYLVARLANLRTGPYADGDTAGAVGLVGEAIRYLHYAAPCGGITEPATVATVAADLALAAYRLPQLLASLGDWLMAEATAGRLADDHRRPPAVQADRIRAVISAASDQADNLAAGLSAVHNLAATLHAVPDPAA